MDEEERSIQLESAPDASQAAERHASAGARDGVKGNRRSLAARAPLHAIVRPRRVGDLPAGACSMRSLWFWNIRRVRATEDAK